MKKLLIIRHAKSSWDYDVNDKDRPLNNRGINDANLLSKHLINKVKDVDFVYSSPAIRALHTCAIFMRNLDLNFDRFLIEKKLYDFSGIDVKNFIKSLNDDYNTVMIFGHNYAFTSLVNELGDTTIENLPTSGMAIVELDLNQWHDLRKGKTKQIIVPKELR